MSSPRYVKGVYSLDYWTNSNRPAQEHLHHPVSTNPSIAPPSLPGTEEESAQGDSGMSALPNALELLLISAMIDLVTVDILPDLVLLEIFDCYLLQSQEEADDYPLDVEAWHTLVHVCQRWRAIVFGSPHRLNLRLFFTNGTPVRETLAVWPPLPIIIWQSGNETWGLDNLVEALEYNDRVCEINLLDVPSPQLEEALAAMQQPFPALTELGIRWQDDETDEIDEAEPVVPDSFLGGNAPRLQHLDLYRVPFPGLPRLLLSATDLVHLYLWKIPHSGYFPPEAMVDCLSALTKLEVLWLGFESPLARLFQDSRRPSPIRSVLPLLTYFKFKGASKYLENLVAPIDAPLLDSLEITFFHQLILDTPQLVQFVSRTPNVKAPVEAHVAFSYDSISVSLPGAFPGRLLLEISCRPSNWQLLSLTQVCSSSFPQFLIPAVERLYISDTVDPHPDWEDDIENDQWLEVLRPFTAVKYLYLSREFAPRIAPTLQELAGESVMEVLPTLRNLFLEELQLSGIVQEAVGEFVAARQLADQPIAISHWDMKREEEFEVDDLPVADDLSEPDDPSVPDDSSVLDDSSILDD
jgi:hypothetical protein